MNIDKAIKVNTASEECFRVDGYVECADAVKLGIEALKRVKKVRNYKYDLTLIPLPGETTE